MKIGCRNRHICWQLAISSFLKGAGTSITISFNGGHKEETVSITEIITILKIIESVKYKLLYQLGIMKIVKIKLQKNTSIEPEFCWILF